MFKHKKLLLSVMLLIVIAVISACGSSNDNNGGEADNNDGNNNTEASADGADVFDENCMSCHGDEGEGESGPDLTGEDDHDAVVEQVEEGGGSMPAFEDDLSDDEIEAVADYVVDELN